MLRINLTKTNPNATIPTRGTEYSAGADLYACISEPVIIHPNHTVKIGTGIAIALPSTAVALVFGRSGLGINYNIAPANAVGVIDSDYRGEIIVGLKNSSEREFVVNPNNRIAQLVVSPVYLPMFNVVDTLDETDRGTGGFGSTGVN